jgi:S-ribosylhomocysteine lyase
MEKIASFKKNHDILEKGLYVSTEIQGITTFDLRFKKPNCGSYLSTKAAHSIEHIIATILRNGEHKDNIIYFGPMGCRTGFYLLTIKMDYKQVLEMLKTAFADADKITEVPGCHREECGNYLDHDLAEAKAECKEYLKVLNNIKI